jgi:hypothetical protein
VGRATAIEGLQRALAAADDAAGREIAAALVHLGGADAVPEAREWLLGRVPYSGLAGELVAALGRLPDPIARAEATRIASENFREKQLPGRWDSVLAGLETPAARATLLQALAGGEEATVWTAVQAMLEAWVEVPSMALPALRELLRDEASPEALRFCAAVLLARGQDVETWPEVLPWLMAAFDAGSDADTMAGPALAVAILLRHGEGDARDQAHAFLLDRLARAGDSVLEWCLPPLLDQPRPALIGALIAACRQRRVGSPSAERLAAAFGGLRDGPLADRALEALLAALEPEEAGASTREATLIAALGHLGHPGALTWLSDRAAASDDPALQAALLAAQARLGMADSIARCASLFTGETEDAIAALSPDATRVAALADVLGGITYPAAIPIVGAALVRALDDPRRAPHAARALVALCPPAPPEAGAEAALSVPSVSPCPEPAELPAATPPPVPSDWDPDLDRTIEWRPEWDVAATGGRPGSRRVAGGSATSPGAPDPPSELALVRCTAPSAAPPETAVPTAELTPAIAAMLGAGRRRDRGRRAANREVRVANPRNATRRFPFFTPMGLQRFSGVAGALATCAIIGMGYMRWLTAETPEPTKPRVLATVIVIRSGATVHSRKGPGYPVIKTGRRGDHLYVVDKTAGWWKVYFANGMSGWIERRDTALVLPDPRNSQSIDRAGSQQAKVEPAGWAPASENEPHAAVIAASP